MTSKIDPILLSALAHQEAYDVGIVPPDKNISHDMGRSLSQLTPEESRRVRRKFRKLWRKLARKNSDATLNELVTVADTANRVGLGSLHPTQTQCIARKASVHWDMYRRARKKLSSV